MSKFNIGDVVRHLDGDIGRVIREENTAGNYQVTYFEGKDVGGTFESPPENLTLVDGPAEPAVPFGLQLPYLMALRMTRTLAKKIRDQVSRGHCYGFGADDSDDGEGPCPEHGSNSLEDLDQYCWRCRALWLLDELDEAIEAMVAHPWIEDE